MGICAALENLKRDLSVHVFSLLMVPSPRARGGWKRAINPPMYPSLANLARYGILVIVIVRLF